MLAESVNSSPLQQVLSELDKESIKPVLPADIMSKPVFVNLSADSPLLKEMDIVKTEVLNSIIFGEMERLGGTVAVGGYLEYRDRYQTSELFRDTEEEPRSIHLGVDLWIDAGTEVYSPLPAKVHSFNDNANYFDYGPTILLEHEVQGHKFHTLYGHLMRESLDELEVGMSVEAGQRIAWLGSAEVNGDWPPHLHFQIIADTEGKVGDYPGVAAPSDMDHYRVNCPDPNLLLRLDELN